MAKLNPIHIIRTCDIRAIESLMEQVERDANIGLKYQELKHSIDDFIKKANVAYVGEHIEILWEALEGMPEYEKLVELCDGK